MTESGTFCKDDWKVKNTGIQQTPAGMSRSPSALPWLCDAARARLANALARLTPACGPHHHAPLPARALARACPGVSVTGNFFRFFSLEKQFLMRERQVLRT